MLYCCSLSCIIMDYSDTVQPDLIQLKISNGLTR